MKEIPTKQSGSTEGDYASEWGFAESPIQQEPLHGWSYKDKDTEWGDYLGWWGRNGRGVYYFGEHQRPPKWFISSETNYWKAYDWYKNTASDINKAFEDEDEARKKLRDNPNIFNLEELIKILPNRKLFAHEMYDYMVPSYNVPIIEDPNTIRNTRGIAAYLQNKYADTKSFLLDFNYKARDFNKKAESIILQHNQRIDTEEKNQARAAEAVRYNKVLTEIGGLREQIGKLGYDIKQIKDNKDKEFSLFKSEITSVIPDQRLNVSRAEHNEDIAQLNETLAGIKKTTNDTIASLQKKVNMSQRSNNDLNVSRERYMNKTFAEHRNLIAGQEEDLQDVKGELRNTNLELHETNERVEKQEENFRETNTVIRARVAALSRDLQALGGKTKEFIDNTKRREQLVKARVAKKESVVTRMVKKAAFPDLTKRPWLGQSVTGRFFQLVNQW